MHKDSLSEISESKIERVVCDYAKGKGWVAMKFTSPSNRSVPDRILMKDGTMFFIEFKRAGKLPTKQQELVFNRLQLEGYIVYVIDNIKDGKKLIDLYEYV